MPFFRRADYTSEMTQLIDKLKLDKPTLEAEQRAGRDIWWDKNPSREEQAQYAEGRVMQQPYVYGTSGHDNSK